MNNGRVSGRGDNQLVGAAMLSFAMPFVVLIAMYALAGIAPFGEKTLLCSHNAEWFSEFAQWNSAMNGSGDLRYSFAEGLGGDFYSRWTDGLCSPFLLIVAHVDSSILPQALVVATLLRAACAGMFAFIMLRYLSGRTPLAAAAFAVAYASGSQLFLSFLAPQHADAAVLLPLVGAGIALLAQKGRATLFFCASAFFLLCCGRLFPLLIFFSIGYFVWCQLVLGSREGLWTRLGLFIASLAASAGVALITLVPAFTVNSELSTAVYEVNQTDSAGFFNMLSSVFSGVYADGAILPLMFCSTMSLLLLPIYLLNSRLPLGERQVCAIFLAMLVLSVCVPAFCWLWLGYSVPTGAVCGFGCVFCLFAVSAAVRLTAQPMRVRVGHVILSWMFAVGMFLAALIFGDADYSVSGIIFTAAFLTMYAAITIVALSGNGISAGFCMVILICVGCECVLGGVNGLNSAAEQIPLVTVTEQESQNRQQLDLQSIISGSEQNEAPSFIRVRGADVIGTGRVDARWDATEQCRTLIEVLGISGSDGYTPVTDAIFGVKYIISGEASDDYPTVGITSGVNVYRNENALGMCLTAPQSVVGSTRFSSNPFNSQNEIVSAIAGAQRELFINASLSEQYGDGAGIIETLDGVDLVRSDSEGYACFTVLIPADGPLYMYLGDTAGSKEKIYVNGSDIGTYNLGAINCIGNFARGTRVSVKVSVSGERLSLRGIWFAVMDTVLTDAALRQIAQQNAVNLTVDGNVVTCTATVSDGQMLATTIPWQAGWKAYVDGAEAETVRIFGSLLGVYTGTGIHDVRLVYEPEDFTVCLIISVTFLLFGFLLTLILDSDRLNAIYENSRREAEEEEAYEPPMQEDMFATYSSYMIPNIQSLDDQEDDFSDYFNGN